MTTFGGVIFTVITAIFWMVIGWRFMRAHEEIAIELRRLGPRQSPTEFR